MSFFDIFHIDDFKQRIKELETQVARQQSVMTPDMFDIVSAKNELAELNDKIERQNNIINSNNQNINQYHAKINQLQSIIDDKNRQLHAFDDEFLVQEFGLYEPKFAFANSTQFKDALKQCRAQQKELIKQFNAEAKQTAWTVNGKHSEGKKMVGQIARLLMEAFNGECDEIVRKVTYSNINKSLERIDKIAENVNKNCQVVGISIPPRYIALKKNEVQLAFEFSQQKEEEKERLRILRAEAAEQKRVEREIEEKRKKLDKERKQYSSAYEKIQRRIETNADDKDLLDKAADLKQHLDDIDKAVKDVDYRAANQKAGFVYIISNVGSFGEGVYKIGMTRRLDPDERIKELSGASVPFGFDIHAMIFSDDAPKLEAALHNAFDDKKVNIVNQRKEFFRVSLQEIEDVVKANYDKTVEFTEAAPAEQYRISEELRKKGIFHYQK